MVLITTKFKVKLCFSLIEILLLIPYNIEFILFILDIKYVFLFIIAVNWHFDDLFVAWFLHLIYYK